MKKTLKETLFRRCITRTVLKECANGFEAFMDKHYIKYDTKNMYVYGCGEIVVYEIYTVGDITVIRCLVDDYLNKI